METQNKKTGPCPLCAVPLEEVCSQGLTVQRCPRCKGFILAQDKINHPHLVTFGEESEAAALQAINELQCPCDGAKMMPSKLPGHRDLEVHVCPECNGAWIDARKLFASSNRIETKKLTQRSLLAYSGIVFLVAVLVLMVRLIPAWLLQHCGAETLKGLCIVSGVMICVSLFGAGLASQEMGSCASGGCCSARIGAGIASLIGSKAWGILAGFFLLAALMFFITWTQHPDKAVSPDDLYLKEKGLSSMPLHLKQPRSQDNAWEKLYRETDDLLQAKKYDEALVISVKALEVAEQMKGREDLDVAQTLEQTSDIYLFQRKYAEAQPFLERALKIREGLLGPNHWEVADTLRDWARLQAWQKDYLQAEAIYKRLVAIDEIKRSQPFQGLSYLAEDLRDLGWVCRNQEKYAEAELFYKQSLKILENRPKENHLMIATIFKDMSVLCRETGRVKEADEYEQQAVRIQSAEK